MNSSDPLDREPIEVDHVKLESTGSEIYLGSVITNSQKLVTDVEADIKQRRISIVKFFAFLRTNKNAPIGIKLKVLDSCVVASLLHNAETWADTKTERLEVIYRRMLKAILGVRMTTVSDLLYIELGVCSIKTKLLM